MKLRKPASAESTPAPTASPPAQETPTPPPSPPPVVASEPETPVRPVDSQAGTVVSPPSDVPDPPPAVDESNLIDGGGFSPGAPTTVEGDGESVAGTDPENVVWQLVGPQEQSITLPIKPTPGRGQIAIRYRVMIPPGTTADGVQFRTRLIDRYQSSAVSNHALPEGDGWQSIAANFEDVGSGPYRLGIEAQGFVGPLHLDDIEARHQVGSTSAEPTTSATPPPAETTDIKQWLSSQAWFKQLDEKMPDGVSLLLLEGDSEQPGWEVIEVREVHAPGSGYDPDVSPMIGIFQIKSDRSETQWFDPVSGDFVPVARFIEDWKLLQSGRG